MSDSDITQNFDGFVIEAIKGIGDVKFARADMDYWAKWAEAVKKQRVDDTLLRINQTALSPLQKIDAVGRAKREEVDLFAVMDLAYTPKGILRMLDEGLARAGTTDEAERKKIIGKIPPRRQAELAQEICSEPRPTVQQLRESLRAIIAKNGQFQNVNAMTDEEIIAAAAAYSPPKAEPVEDAGDESPLPVSPQAEPIATGG